MLVMTKHLLSQQSEVLDSKSVKIREIGDGVVMQKRKSVL